MVTGLLQWPCLTLCLQLLSCLIVLVLVRACQGRLNYSGTLLKLRITPGASFKTLCPSVSEQPNYWDYGLFIMKYISLLLDNPRMFIWPGPRSWSCKFWILVWSSGCSCSAQWDWSIGGRTSKGAAGGMWLLIWKAGKLKLPIIDFTNVKVKWYIWFNKYGRFF